jgi:hypothetical protein
MINRGSFLSSLLGSVGWLVGPIGFLLSLPRNHPGGNTNTQSKGLEVVVRLGTTESELKSSWCHWTPEGGQEARCLWIGGEMFVSGMGECVRVKL